jgi:hypothetical protein
LIRWRGAVASAIRGKRGQRLLRDLIAALDAMPVKELIKHELIAEGQVCALGALGVARGLSMDKIDAYDREQVGRAFDIAEALAAEILYENDDGRTWVYEAADQHRETPAETWERMRAWAAQHLGQE